MHPTVGFPGSAAVGCPAVAAPLADECFALQVRRQNRVGAQREREKVVYRRARTVQVVERREDIFGGNPAFVVFEIDIFIKSAFPEAHLNAVGFKICVLMVRQLLGIIAFFGGSSRCFVFHPKNQFRAVAGNIRSHERNFGGLSGAQGNHAVVQALLVNGQAIARQDITAIKITVARNLLFVVQMRIQVAGIPIREVFHIKLVAEGIIAVEPQAVDAIFIVHPVHKIVHLQSESCAGRRDGKGIAFDFVIFGAFRFDDGVNFAAQGFMLRIEPVSFYLVHARRGGIVDFEAEQHGVHQFVRFGIPDLKVQVCPARPACIAGGADSVAFFEGKNGTGWPEVNLKTLLIVLHFLYISRNFRVEPAQVRILAGVAVGVGDVNGIAVAAGLHPDARNIAVCDGVKGCAFRSADVQTCMEMVGAQLPERSRQLDRPVYRGTKIPDRIQTVFRVPKSHGQRADHQKERDFKSHNKHIFRNIIDE